MQIFFYHRFPSPKWEKVPAEQRDEGLTTAARTSSVASRDPFSFKEKEQKDDVE